MIATFVLLAQAQFFSKEVHYFAQNMILYRLDARGTNAHAKGCLLKFTNSVFDVGS